MSNTVISLSDSYELLDEMNRIGGGAWPEFMLHDPVSLAHWTDLVEAFKEYQLILMDGEEILAIVNTAPLNFSRDLTELPDEGVDWGVKKAISDHQSGTIPNTLMAVQVVVAKTQHGKGLSVVATQAMLKLARDKGFRALIVPLRPSNKYEYPLIDMNDYLQWKNQEGLPFDNWLRVHIKAGGKILGICRNSMYISGAVREWEEWTNQTFPGSGKYVVPGALNPVIVDLEKDIGVYIEPNIWIAHDIKNA